MPDQQPSILSRYCLLGLLLILISACSASQPAQPLPAPPTLTLPPAITQAEPALRVGVLINNNVVDTTNEWSPLMEYLSQSLGRRFELQPIRVDDMLSQIEQGTIDFALSNSIVAVQAQRIHSAEIIATLASPRMGPLFAGLIIVRKDSSIMTINDLRDKTVAFLSSNSDGGYAFQAYYLLQHGLDPQKDFGAATTIASQDSVALAVLNGSVDVGFVSTGILEGLIGKELITNLDDFRIIDQVDDEYVYPHTTPRYPEWAFYALNTTDPALTARVKSTLLTMPSGHPALVAARIRQFVEPVDYTLINDLIDRLDLPGSDIPR